MATSRVFAYAASLICCVGTCLAEPPQYVATDITNWTPAQRAALPFFKHYIPVQPTGANVPFGFTAIARSANGLYAGIHQQGFPQADNRASRVSSTTNAEIVEPFGAFVWSYWSCDAHDCHFYNGVVHETVPFDMNWEGTIVGKSSMPGVGGAGTFADYHGFVHSVANGRRDLLTDAKNAWATCINNAGEIGGIAWGNEGSLWGAFRMSRESQPTLLATIGQSLCQPMRINGRGVIAGEYYPSKAFVSPSGATTIQLPDLGTHEMTNVRDLNDANWVVGRAGSFNDPETFAVIWEPLPNGTWEAHELVEYVTTPDVLLESAIAINERGEIIAWGHPDGTDAFGSHTYLLTPQSPLDTWCAPDIGQHPASVIACNQSVSMSVVVVNESQVTGYQWYRNGVQVSVLTNPTAVASTLLLPPVSSADEGTYACTVTSACGSMTSASATLRIVCSQPCDSIDFNADGLFPDDNDLVDFLVVLAGGECRTGTCNDIDFNNDGLFPDDMDLIAFLRVLAGGSC